MERILNRVLIWAGYGERATFFRQNEIALGIDECYRELSACSNRFQVRPFFHSARHYLRSITPFISFQPHLR